MAPTGDLSPATRARLEDELAQLREQRETILPKLGDDPLGDSADQASLFERAEAAARLDRRIHEITDLLAGVVAAEDEDDLPAGTTVKLKFDDGSVDTLRVVSIAEEAEDEPSAVTADSPLGQAIAGHKAGETITYRTPSGELSAEIVELTPPK
jgi:transcription elongation factor GreA